MAEPPFTTAVFSGAGLSCRRGGRLVLSDVSFRVAAGEALVLRGPNGSGKTTLLRLMAGLARAVAGRLTWNGADIAEDLPVHGARLGFASHLDAVKPAQSVRENLQFWAELRNAPASSVDAAISAYALDRLAELPGRVLSAGQRHRVALARLLVSGAQLWLLDEPVNTLDDAAQLALKTALQSHLQRGGLVVLASHGETLLPGAASLTLDPARMNGRAAA
ncbi:MAG: heme ABC exporter ATP-binding protein CcmA [Rhodospirillaceae bacterium]|nr:heme ABC exporter ATP-binding protein CcmA [Rhodospirillaceae bacterium]